MEQRLALQHPLLQLLLLSPILRLWVMFAGILGVVVAL